MQPEHRLTLSRENVGDSDRSSARTRFIAWRQQIGAQQKAQWDADLCQRLVAILPQWWVAGHSPTIGVYWPISNEPDLSGLYNDCWARGYQLALPRVVKKNQPLEFGAFGPETGRRPAGFGTQVPEPFVAVVPELLIIPCVGFSADAFRLGYGGGYYDRTLAQLPSPAIGVAYDGCEWPQWQAQTHDQPLSMVVTQSRTIRKPDPAR